MPMKLRCGPRIFCFKLFIQQELGFKLLDLLIFHQLGDLHLLKGYQLRTLLSYASRSSW